MIFSLFLITIVYTTISYILVGNVSLDILKDDYKPIYTLANKFIWRMVINNHSLLLEYLQLISMAPFWGFKAISRFPFYGK